jgi:hypothetical protein
MSDASRASVASMARHWSLECFPDLNHDDTVSLRFTLERAADLLANPLRWDDVAEEALGVMKVAADVAAKKAADDIYQRILDASMDYLEENLRFNIATTLATAERERKGAQDRVAGLLAQLDAARAHTSEVRQRMAAEVDDLRSLLTQAREFVTDSLEAHEHSDGRELLTAIDTALHQAPTPRTEDGA